VSLSRFSEIFFSFPFNGQEIVVDASSITRGDPRCCRRRTTVAVIGKSNTRRLGWANVAATVAASSDTFHVAVSDGDPVRESSDRSSVEILPDSSRTPRAGRRCGLLEPVLVVEPAERAEEDIVAEHPPQHVHDDSALVVDERAKRLACARYARR
jgi:hypothetical protein